MLVFRTMRRTQIIWHYRFEWEFQSSRQARFDELLAPCLVIWSENSRLVQKLTLLQLSEDGDKIFKLVLCGINIK